MLIGHLYIFFRNMSVQVLSRVLIGLFFLSFFFFAYVENMSVQLKNLPANSGDLSDKGSISGLGRSLEKEMATHSSILAWEIPWTEELGRLQSTGLQESGMT